MQSPEPAALRLFLPRLAGARLPDRLAACLGALLGIALTAIICAALPIPHGDLPLIVAPLGASAVLMFAVPASPMAQPWAVIGGNMVSALVGVAVVKGLSPGPLAAGVAVGGAILAMSALRCLHPPGGAAALTAVIGGPAVTHAGFAFALVPVALNAALLVALALVFHRFSHHSYPHRASALPSTPVQDEAMFDMDDIDRALEDLGETFDVAREDLDMLFRRVEYHAERRLAAARWPAKVPRQ